MTKSDKSIIVLLLLVIALVIIIMINLTEEAVQNCINNGVDPKICEELRD